MEVHTSTENFCTTSNAPMTLILTRKTDWLFGLLLMLASVGAEAQRVFITNINGVNRSYLLYSNTANYDMNTNKPILILLHENGKFGKDAYAKAAWKSVKEPAIFVFPNAVKGVWDCTNDSTSVNDIEFLRKIISDTYQNFHIDRNRVYVLGSTVNECLITQFKVQNPKISASFSRWEQSSTDSLKAVRDVEQALRTVTKADSSYALWEDPLRPKRLSPIDSLKGFRLHNRIVVEVRYGAFGMMGSARTWITDGTYADFYKARSVLDVHVTKWMNDSVAWFVDVGRIQVPMSQEVTGSGTIKSGGGMIMPLTLGFKYALPRVKAHPYFLLGSGVIQAMAFGGKINPGSMPAAGARPNFNNEMRMVFHTTIGTGIDLRFTKRFTLGAHLRYIHSAQFKSAAKVDAIRGFNLNVGLGYIINANSLRKLPFSLTSTK